jgi:hypothetical protein
LPPLFDKSRLLVKFLLLLLQPAVFGPGAGQVALAPKSVALLATLVPRRDNAQHASRRAGGARPHNNKTFGQKEVGKLITTEGAGG